jgi:taurine transport system substrate-binding protein
MTHFTKLTAAAALMLGTAGAAWADGHAVSLTAGEEINMVLLPKFLGILVFDVTSATASYVAESGDDLAKFLKVTADANAMWNSGENTDKMLPVIAKDAGMDEAATAETLAGFVFPSVEDQLSAKWFGGGSQAFMGGVADVFLESGSIDKTLESYEGTVNTGPLMAVKGM